jgi:hypothetical protein
MLRRTHPISAALLAALLLLTLLPAGTVPALTPAAQAAGAAFP